MDVIANVQFNGTDLLSIGAESLYIYDERRAQAWVGSHINFVLQASVFYVISIFGIQRWLRDREPFKLDGALVLWNGFLAAFSFFVTAAVVQDLLTILYNYGLAASVCQSTASYSLFLFTLSKFVEFLDTYFIVLRKRPLLFLHWYHHIFTLVYAFVSFPQGTGINRWGTTINGGIHTIMYSYYMLRALRWKVPGTVAKTITSLQILQFVTLFMLLNIATWQKYISQLPCALDAKSATLAYFMNFTYLPLFVNFFLQSYVYAGGKSKYKSQKEE